MDKKLLRPDEVAENLSVSKWTIYRWIDEGKLKGTRIVPGGLRIFSDSVEDLIKKGQTFKHEEANTHAP
ncbi:MAG: helix-turn-helix domain-containing protein [Nitrospiria bacterium]